MIQSRSISLTSGALAVAALLAIGGCRKSEEKKPAADTKTAAADESGKRAKGAKDEGIEVPTEEDFEATVEGQITAESDLTKELDEIEKQIAQ